MTARPATVPDVLDAAADQLEQHGWTQGAYRLPDGVCCVRGALAYVRGVGDDYAVDDAVIRRALATLGDHLIAHSLVNVSDGDLADGVCPVITFNDEPGRTAAEVIATLRQVAQQQRQAAQGGGAR